ncbi:hypothetical protein [Bradyrhizobium sp. USDA 10063]
MLKIVLFPQPVLPSRAKHLPLRDLQIKLVDRQIGAGLTRLAETLRNAIKTNGHFG